jgi:hypothetical protein
MSINTIKAEKLVRTALGLLERETVLPRLVWRNAGGSFRGAKDDTITFRLPSYAVARKRNLRSGSSRTVDDLAERVVTVALTDDIYKRVKVTDEELTLDIDAFAEQVLAPNLNAIVRQLEDEVVAEVTGASYASDYSIELDESAPTETLTHARRLLNDARVPFSGRSVIVGSAVEEVLINDLTPVLDTGSTGALREATIGRLRGFDVVSVPSLPPEKAYAFHQTAYVLGTETPEVPDGAPWGSAQEWEGFSLRVVQVLDPDTVENNVHFDVFAGTNHTTDIGHFDDSGYWVPAVDPDDEAEDEEFVRAVEIAIGS